MDFTNPCYKTKQDKEKSRIVSKPLGISQERWEEIFGTEEERQEKIRRFMAEKRETPKSPKIVQWNEEWSVMATGKRMSKNQLKEYCKTHSKVWENG